MAQSFRCKRRPAGAVRIAGLLVLVTCAAVMATAAHAALWKWVDANGRVVYSDVPPAGDVKVERINTPPARANPNAAKEMANQEAELKKRQQQRTEDGAKLDKAKADATRKQEQCAQARGQIQSLKAPNVVHYRINERGEQVILDAAAQQKEIERLEGVLRTQCAAAS